MPGSEDAGEEPVPPSPTRQPRPSGYARRSSSRASLSQDQANNNDLVITTELAENIPVPKSRPLGRSVSSRRSIMSSSTAAVMSQMGVSRSDSGSSCGTNRSNRRGSVILAQLREAAGAMKQGYNSSTDENDKLIDFAVNAVMGEPDMETSSILTPSRAVSGSTPSVTSRASRASSRSSVSKEPSQLESRFAGVSKSAPASTAAMEANVPTLGDSASSLAKEAPVLASVASNKEETPDSPGGVEAERPDLGERQPSWMRDALGQMTEGDLQAFLNDDSHAGAASGSGASNLLVDGFENTEVLEQYRIIAHHEARQRVKENLGYDPVERMQEEQLNSKQGSSRSGGGGGGGSGSGKKETTVSKVTLPPMCPPAVIPAATFSICLPKQPLPECRFLAPTVTPRQPELCKGQVVPGTSGSSSNHSRVDSSREIVARCLGCRSHLQVPIHATLVHCPQCSTISPATSTR
jgi:hypothetical protein